MVLCGFLISRNKAVLGGGPVRVAPPCSSMKDNHPTNNKASTQQNWWAFQPNYADSSNKGNTPRDSATKTSPRKREYKYRTNYVSKWGNIDLSLWLLRLWANTLLLIISSENWLDTHGSLPSNFCSAFLQKIPETNSEIHPEKWPPQR